MKLVLLRHAKAEPFGDDASDFSRRLEPAGRRRAWATAHALQRLGVAPDLALVSPSTRTVETWETVQPILKGRMRTVDALYHAAPETIMDAVAEAAKPDLTLVVVGHNPGMRDLALTLAESANTPHVALHMLGEGFPTASAIVFDWDPETDEPRFEALVVRGRTLTAI